MYCSLVNPAGSNELERLKEKNKILHETLVAENCPETGFSKRELPAISPEGILLELEQKLQQRLISVLIKCRQDKQLSSTTDTIVQQPDECQKAINLTEPWRIHTNNSMPKRGFPNCDTLKMRQDGRPWFRFSEDAGDQLLNYCPPSTSCGTYISVWSDASMPDKIGMEKAFSAFGSWNDACKSMSIPMKVLRCSARHSDFVYRFEGSMGCYVSFCGMSAN